MGPARGPAKDEALLAQTEKDFGLFWSHPKPRDDLGTEYGKGKWRPMHRFVIWQSQDEKWRCIDDGHYSVHSEALRRASPRC